MKTLIILFLVSLPILKTNAQNWEFINTGNSGIQTNAISSLYFDNNKTLWISSYDKGLIKYNGNNFVVFNSATNDDFNADFVNEIVRDDAGNYWVSTEYDGLYEYSNSSWIHFTPDDMGFNLGAFKSLHLRKLAIQNGGPGFKQGALWIGSYSNGLIKYNGTNWIKYNYQQGVLPDNGIHAINIEESLTDTSYAIWVGTGSGLLKFDGVSWNRSNILGDSTKWVNAIIFENGGTTFSNGKMYVGTESGEFCIFDGSQWAIFNLADAWNPNNAITDIKIDNSGRKWIGTDHTGLSMYDGTKLLSYYKDNSPIPGDNVECIAVKNTADSNQIWISTYDNDHYNGLTIITMPIVTGINDNAEFKPNDFKLSQNYPNPFNPTTTIEYSIPAQTRHALSVRLTVFDILGRKVATLVNKKQSPGNYSVQFNAANLSSGIYLYKLDAGNFRSTKKMIVLK